MLAPEELKRIFSQLGAFISDSHLLYTSGKHGNAYVNKDALYPHTATTSLLCKELALHFKDLPIDAVLAPALGGIILSQWIAWHLSELKSKEVLAIYAEKSVDGETFIIKRGYDELIRNKNVLIVEDILTTGGSVKKVVTAVQSIPAKIIGVGALCNRGGITSEHLGNVPTLFSLLNVTLESWEPDECPLCKKGIPLNTQVGKAKK